MNIFRWSRPSKHVLVLKTCLENLFNTSSTSLFFVFQDVLEDEKLLQWRRLQDILKTCLEGVLKACLEDVLKICLEDVLKSYLEDVSKPSWRQKNGDLHLTNVNVYVTNKSIFHKSIFDESKANPKSLTRTQWFQYSSSFEIQAAFLFWEWKFLMTVWCCLLNQLNSNSTLQNRWGNKN